MDAAATARNTELHAQAAIELAELANDQERRQDAKLLAKLSRAAVALAGTPLLLTTKQMMLEARIAQFEGHFAQSEGLLRTAIARYEAAGKPNALEYATLLSRLGSLLWEQDRFGEGAEVMKRNLDTLGAALGPKHPRVASVMISISLPLRELGQFVEARRYNQAALDILLETLGPNHTETGRAYGVFGATLDLMGEHERAIVYTEKAIAIDLRTYGADYRHLGTWWNNLGCAYESVGRLEDAVRMWSRAITQYEKALGPAHPRLIEPLNSLAGAAIRKNPRAALAYVDRALQIALAARPPLSLALTETLTVRADVLVALGRKDEAKRDLERALTFEPRFDGSDGTGIARARFALARLTWSEDRKSARRLAVMARVAYAKNRSVGGVDYQGKEIETWLARH
jgi:tetratricopeptide (TPR) repeat protein